jgi:hypothetical protein
MSMSSDQKRKEPEGLEKRGVVVTEAEKKAHEDVKKMSKDKKPPEDKK